jgi:hypothetical protein
VSRRSISASAHRLLNYKLLTESTARRCESIASSRITSLIIIFRIKLSGHSFLDKRSRSISRAAIDLLDIKEAK